MTKNSLNRQLPVLRRSALIIVVSVLTLSLFWCGFASTTVAQSAGDSVSQSIFGYRIDCHSPRGEWCSVRSDHGDTVSIIYEGDRQSSEAFLVKRLKEEHGHGNPNVPFPTLGGKQFWGDVFFHAGWRIQKNLFTDHYRLLDPGDVRRAWGDYEGLRSYYEQVRRREQLKHNSRHAVVLVHGIFRSSQSFGSMEESLAGEGFQPVPFNYPSTRRSLRAHAEQLNTMLDRLPEADTVSFVTHSLGGLVVREALAGSPVWKQRLTRGRIVMIAPPNQGSRVSQDMDNFLPYQLLTGPAGQDLTPDSARDLPVPEGEIGIIAGRWTGPGLFDVWLGEPADGTVEVQSTRMAGMTDFVIVEGIHSFIMDQPQTIRQTLCFLRQELFCSVDRDLDSD